MWLTNYNSTLMLNTRHRVELSPLFRKEIVNWDAKIPLKISNIKEMHYSGKNCKCLLLENGVKLFLKLNKYLWDIILFQKIYISRNFHNRSKAACRFMWLKGQKTKYMKWYVLNYKMGIYIKIICNENSFTFL